MKLIQGIYSQNDRFWMALMPWRGRHICTIEVLRFDSQKYTYIIYINRRQVSNMIRCFFFQFGNEGQHLPMHTLPFLTKPSLQVHTKEPKVFAQVECSGHVPLIWHSSTSVVIKGEMWPLDSILLVKKGTNRNAISNKLAKTLKCRGINALWNSLQIFCEK